MPQNRFFLKKIIVFIFHNSYSISKYNIFFTYFLKWNLLTIFILILWDLQFVTNTIYCFRVQCIWIKNFFQKKKPNYISLHKFIPFSALVKCYFFFFQVGHFMCTQRGNRWVLAHGNMNDVYCWTWIWKPRVSSYCRGKKNKNNNIFSVCRSKITIRPTRWLTKKMFFIFYKYYWNITTDSASYLCRYSAV